MTRILLFEDDQNVARTLSKILQSSGHSVSWLPSGKAAFDAISQGGFDLVVSDLFMPEKDGIEVVMEVRRNWPTTPIILMTGGSNLFPHGSEHLSNLTDSAELFGSVQLLHKPFRNAELLEMISFALKNAHSKDSTDG